MRAWRSCISLSCLNKFLVMKIKFTGSLYQDRETGIYHCNECPKTYKSEVWFLKHWGKYHDEDK